LVYRVCHVNVSHYLFFKHKTMNDTLQSKDGTQEFIEGLLQKVREVRDYLGLGHHSGSSIDQEQKKIAKGLIANIRASIEVMSEVSLMNTLKLKPACKKIEQVLGTLEAGVQVSDERLKELTESNQ
jgi:hypothetical protein